MSELTNTNATQEMEKLENLSADDPIALVETHLKRLGYDLTPYGAGVALLELESGYSPIDAASHIALTTLARDVREAGEDILKLIKFVPHCRTMIHILTEYKNKGLMSEKQFQNDGRALLGVVVVDKEQKTWIDRVLSDPIAGKERLAISRINYEDM